MLLPLCPPVLCDCREPGTLINGCVESFGEESVEEGPVGWSRETPGAGALDCGESVPSGKVHEAFGCMVTEPAVAMLVGGEGCIDDCIAGMVRVKLPPVDDAEQKQPEAVVVVERANDGGEVCFGENVE